LTIVDEGRFNPAIDPNAFPSTPVDVYWSSSPVFDGLGDVWTVTFDDGTVPDGFLGPTATHRVRCVR
jgi:hypothetical protein